MLAHMYTSFFYLFTSFTRQVWYQNMQVKDEQGGGSKIHISVFVMKQFTPQHTTN